jgi:hypothetical protein
LNSLEAIAFLPMRKVPRCLPFATFCIAKGVPTDYGEAPAIRGRRGGLAQSGSISLTGIELDDNVQKSCWGVTAKALIGFAGIILLAWLFSGGDAVAVLAAG